ncbi:MAG: hypothetical protein IJ717_06680 [Treponema sp.]|nr:hypothetical protein [Treponema sp.]
MKLSKKILAALSAAALLATTALFASCSDDEDDGKTGTAYVTLPESVGENPLKGKAWKYQYTDTYGDGSDSWSGTWSFTDTTATYTEIETDYTEIETYKYSYDANQNLLYLALLSRSNSFLEDGKWISDSWSSVEEYEEQMKKWYEEEGVSLSDVELKWELEWEMQDFSTRGVRKYTIGDDGSLTLEDYFDGNLPTECNFNQKRDESDLSGYVELYLHSFYSSDSEYEYTYNYFPSFNTETKTFSGNLYYKKRQLDKSISEYYTDQTKLGTVKGTYTTEGIGTSGCKVTLTFTSLPNGVPVIKTNTAYELEQSSGSGTIYTLVK